MEKNNKMKKNKIIIIIAIAILVAILGVTINPKYSDSLGINSKDEKNISLPTTQKENPLQNDGSKPMPDDLNQKRENKTSHDIQKEKEMYDDFSSGPYHLVPGTVSPNGKWFGMWNGGGSLDVKQDPFDNNNYIFVVESGFVLNETRSGLVLTTSEYKDFVLSLDVRNDKQLREPNPNSWEVGWIFWRYVDNTHFNYFTLKPTGSESGKYDGGVNPTDQLYIQDTEFPSTSIGKWDHLDIIVKGNHVTIAVNGIIAQEFDDISSFDKGKIGLYCEDASVSFDNISITPI